MNDIQEDFFGCIESPGRGITDVELHDLVTFLFKPVGFLQDRTTDVVTDIVELFRLDDPATQLWHPLGYLSGFWLVRFHCLLTHTNISQLNRRRKAIAVEF